MAKIDLKSKNKKVKFEEREEQPETQLIEIPYLDSGLTIHLNIKKGDGMEIEMLIIVVANRIVTVGDSKRAWKISRFFDNPDTTINVFSTRIFKTYTGTFKGVPITVVTTGMGVPMIDFVIREI